MCNGRSKFNVFIFNYIQNNEKDISRLVQTFKKLNCLVKVHNQLKYVNFKSAVEYIKTANFTLFEYIVIIILDNRNDYQHLIRTSDNCDVYLNAELLTYILQNESLADKKRLFVIQTNQTVSEDDYETPKLSDFFWDGPTIRIYALEPDMLLDNDWSEPMAKENRFIKAFCDNFEEYAETEDINQIFEKIHAAMIDCEDTPVIEHGITRNEMCIFGKALSEDEMRDFFNDEINK